jgi:hypothetical protein
MQVKPPLYAIQSIVHTIESPFDVIEPVFNVIEPRIDTAEPGFDAIHAFFDTVNPAALNCNLRLQLGQVHLKARYANLEVGHVNAHCPDRPLQLLLAAPELLLAAPQDLELLHDEFGGFVNHGINLTASVPQCYSQSHDSLNAKADHIASAPEMISISSLVIIAWRVRL